MYAGRPGCNGDGVSRLGTQDLARRGDELRQDQGRGGRRGGLQVVTRGGEGALQGAGEGEAREPRVERLEATPVILPRDGLRRQQCLGRAYHEPQREQALAFGPTHRLGDQPDQALLGGRGGAAHATRRSTVAATSSGVMSVRQRWWPNGQAAVPVDEQGRHSSPRSSTTAGAR